ncbi:MAG TPA: hypothetical protein VJ577_07785 [Burkholderiaceae bacterium]|nr:hypothetical protein [Burkholderiaceae bacterium]
MADKAINLLHENHASRPTMNASAILKAIGVFLIACGGITYLAKDKSTVGAFIIAAGCLTYLAVLIGEWWEKK